MREREERECCDKMLPARLRGMVFESKCNIGLDFPENVSIVRHCLLRCRRKCERPQKEGEKDTQGGTQPFVHVLFSSFLQNCIYLFLV